MGVRKDLGALPRLPQPIPGVVTLRDVITGIDPGAFMELKVGSKDRERYPHVRRGEPFDKMLTRRAGRVIAIGFNHRRLRWDAPCPTIVAQCSAIYHPDEPRTLGINELKRVSAFPDDFILEGLFSQQWERIGRAVPPLLMKAVAETVKEVLDGLR